MVFFTCNHCGESVKKPAVEKHYFTKCRRAPVSVSCMDCQKDFHDNYVEHIKCISETEKYSGKNYVPKESANKGAKKQEGWTEVVRSVLASKDLNLNKKIRQAFLTLQNYDNIPRKKASFFNFISNSVHLGGKAAEEVWDILEKELQKMKQAPEQANRKSKVREIEDAKATNDDKDQHPDSKKADENTENNIENGEMKNSNKKNPDAKKADEKTENNIENGEMKNSNKKKKKKQKEKQVTDPTQLNDTEQNGVERKKKKSKAKTKTNVPIAPEISVKEMEKSPDDQDGKSEEKKSKKKKHKIEENGTKVEEPEKKKKKTEKLNDNEQNDGNEEYVFNWKTELERIIGKNPEGIKLEKLRKKILKKYRTAFPSTEFSEQQEKHFGKKFIKKLKNPKIQIEGDVIKVLS